MKKILYYFRHEQIYGTLFFDINGPIDFVHENDANWSNEYLGFIPKYFEGEVKNCKYDITMKQSVLLEYVDSKEKIWKILGPSLLKTIK